MTLKDLLKKHEGLRLKPYRCTAGKLTIGYGRNLEDRGISPDEAEYLLENDITEAIGACQIAFGWYDGLDNVHKAVVTDMVFNLGIEGFKKFKGTIVCIEAGDWTGAALGMLNSLWAKQVGQRANELSEMMRNGH